MLIRKGPDIDWQVRLQLVDRVLVLCFFCILYGLFIGKDTPLINTIVNDSFMLIGTTLSIYIGGRTYNDISMQRMGCPSTPRPILNEGQITNGPIIGPESK